MQATLKGVGLEDIRSLWQMEKAKSLYHLICFADAQVNNVLAKPSEAARIPKDSLESFEDVVIGDLMTRLGDIPGSLLDGSEPRASWIHGSNQVWFQPRLSITFTWNTCG